MERLIAAAVIAAIVLVASFAATERGPWLAPFCLAIGAWVMAGALAETAFRIKLGKGPLGDSLRRLVNLPRAAIGTMLAHFGVGLMVIGIVGTTAYKSEEILLMRPGESK